MNTSATLGSIAITDAGKRVEIDLADVLEIDEQDISKEYTRFAAVYGYFASMLARADRALAIADARTEQAYAEADDFWREENKGEKMTEARIKSLIMLDEKYIQTKDAEIQAKYNHQVIKALVNALDKKGEMLISLGAHIRQEANMTGMTMRDKEMDDAVKRVKEASRRR